LVTNFLIYNFRVIIYYITGFEVGSIKLVSPIRFLLFALFAFVLIINEDRKKNIFLYFGLIATPVFILDSTTLFLGKELVPLRFPFDTTYPLLGTILGLLFSFKLNKRIVISSLVFSFIYIIIGELYVRPSLAWYIHTKRTSSIILDQSHSKIFYDTLKTVNGVNTSVNNFTKNPIVLIDFYFVGCKPCDEKLFALSRLKKKYGKIVEIVLICDGSITDFRKFIDHANKNVSSEFNFFYYEKPISGKYPVFGFPTEFLFYNKVLIQIDNGFGKEVEDKWLEKEIKTIDKALL
jgi:hypothetical protein